MDRMLINVIHAVSSKAPPSRFRNRSTRVYVHVYTRPTPWHYNERGTRTCEHHAVETVCRGVPRVLFFVLSFSLSLPLLSSLSPRHSTLSRLTSHSVPVCENLACLVTLPPSPQREHRGIEKSRVATDRAIGSSEIDSFEGKESRISKENND